jgi:hypothetical protein
VLCCQKLPSIGEKAHFPPKPTGYFQTFKPFIIFVLENPAFVVSKSEGGGMGENTGGGWVKSR